MKFVKLMIKDIKDFYDNKKVVFNTTFGHINENTRNFRLYEESVNKERYVIHARIEEFDDHVEVIGMHIDILNQ